MHLGISNNNIILIIKNLYYSVNYWLQIIKATELLTVKKSYSLKGDNFLKKILKNEKTIYTDQA